MITYTNPLRYLFCDMNAFFASCEQQDRPELRGRPIGIVPMMVDTTCCIAASYEAKKFGVKTGTSVEEAKRLCPHIHLIHARPEHYIRIHHRIVAALESCLHVDAVMSIDEMMMRLVGDHRNEQAALGIAADIKATFKRELGDNLKCSIGIGPNRLLAKMAADMQKPDGCTMIRAEELPDRLYELELQDFVGLGRGMEKRFWKYGIASVKQMYTVSIDQMCKIWESKLMGRTWHGRIRGDEIVDPPQKKGSVGHSHVLPPDLRKDAEARSVLLCMTHKAASVSRSQPRWT